MTSRKGEKAPKDRSHRGGGGGLSEAAVARRLAGVDNSTTSIQTVSLWLAHHGRGGGGEQTTLIGRSWADLFHAPTTEDARRLTLLHLANELLQTSRRKGDPDGFLAAFRPLLLPAFQLLAVAEVPIRERASRVLQVWRDRDLFDGSLLQACQALLSLSTARHLQNDEDTDEEQLDADADPSESEDNIDERLFAALETATGLEEERKKRRTSVDGLHLGGQLRKDIRPDGKMDGELSPVAGRRLAAEGEEALRRLRPLNGHLEREWKEARRLRRLIGRVQNRERSRLAAAEEELTAARRQLDAVRAVREQLAEHLRNLPDLSALPLPLLLTDRDTAPTIDT